MTKLLKYGFLLLCAAGLSLWIAYRVARSQDFMVNGDFFTFWLSGHMVASGENPYDSAPWLAHHVEMGATWIPNRAFVYPLPLAILFVPLGRLALTQAAIIWVAVSIGMTLIAILLLSGIRISLWGKMALLLPILAGVFTFRPVMVTYRNGQLGAFWLLTVAGIAYFWVKERWFASGVLLALFLLKPSFGIFIVGLAGFWLLVNRKWSGILGLALAALGLLVSGWLFDLNWVPRYLAAGGNKYAESFGQHPTLWGMVHYMLGSELLPTVLVGGAAALLLVGTTLAVIWFYRGVLAPEQALAVAVVIGLLLTPYLWAYDQILLILPILVVCGYLQRSHAPYLLITSLPIWLSLLALVLVAVAVHLGVDVWSGLLTVVCGGLVVWMIFQDIRGQRTQRMVG